MKQRFIQSFSTSGTEQEALTNGLLGKPYICFIEEGQYIDWNTLSPTPEPVYSAMPLTFEIISGGTIGFTSPIGVTIEYSADNGQTWDVFSSLEVETGDKIMFRGTGRTATADDINKSSIFTSSNDAKFNIVGNINSLLDKTNYTGITSLSSYGTHTFLRLFTKLKGLVSAENLVLPATTLTSFCYGRMFSECSNLIKTPKLPANNLANYCYFVMFGVCTSLTEAPELPATRLVEYCYNSMFQNCTGLTTAPELPATTLKTYCYYNMFRECRSLTTAPSLPATTLANYCYRQMFYNCTSLNYIKCLATDISANECTADWVDGVASSGTFVKDPIMTGWTTSVDGIPTGWTVIDA